MFVIPLFSFGLQQPMTNEREFRETRDTLFENMEQVKERVDEAEQEVNYMLTSLQHKLSVDKNLLIEKYQREVKLHDEERQRWEKVFEERRQCERLEQERRERIRHEMLRAEEDNRRRLEVEFQQEVQKVRDIRKQRASEVEKSISTLDVQIKQSREEI